MDCKKLTDIYSKSCVELIENSPKYDNKKVIETNDLKFLNCYSIMFKINSFCNNQDNSNNKEKK